MGEPPNRPQYVMILTVRTSKKGRSFLETPNYVSHSQQPKDSRAILRMDIGLLYTNMQISIHIFVSMCMYVYTYIYIHIYIYTSFSKTVPAKASYRIHALRAYQNMAHTRDLVKSGPPRFDTPISCAILWLVDVRFCEKTAVFVGSELG